MSKFDHLTDSAPESLDWDKAFEHADEVRKSYQSLVGKPGVNVSFALFLSINPIMARYHGGERTTELYTEMMEME